jgi:hypothetical protein
MVAYLLGLTMLLRRGAAKAFEMEQNGNRAVA